MTNMIGAVNWQFALLKQNPFPNSPPRRSEEAVWAGMSRLKSQFSSLFAEALTTSVTQVVLNRGAWGSGKTHAAVFFGERNRFPAIKGTQVEDALILYVRTPKEPAKIDMILYQDLIEDIRFGRLRQFIRKLIEEHGQQETLTILQNTAQSEVLGRAILLLGLERNTYGQLRLFDELQETPEWRRMLEASFFSQATKTDLKELGLSRGITSSQDRFRVLSTALNSIIGFAPTQDIQKHWRVILWIDEMEDLIYLSSRQHRPFTQGLRDLIDHLPQYFTLLMNFTLAVPEEWEDINVILGGALMDRVTHHIYFQEPNRDEAAEYVHELLRLFRTEDPANYGAAATYPLTEEALHMAISTLHSCTPRDLNQRFSDIVSKALQRGIITGPGQGTITADFISDLDQERVEIDLNS